MVLNFVTGNIGKLRELTYVINKDLSEVELRQLNVDLPEYQGNPEYIVEEKLKAAFNSVSANGPILVEDTSLFFNAFNSLPGPYIKYFLKELGANGLYKLLTSFDDHSAIAQSIFGLQIDVNSKPILFTGRINGSIVEPKGDSNFGWDSCFKPDGYDLTFGQMTEDLKNKISHRSLSIKKLIEWLKNNN